jgi:hypothetical protein
VTCPRDLGSCGAQFRLRQITELSDAAGVLVRVIWDSFCENDLAETDQGLFLGPVDGCVVHDVVVVCHLHQNLKSHRATRDSLFELVKKVVCIFAFGRRLIQMFGARVRPDPVPSLAAHTIFVDETQRGHPEV